MTFHVLHVIGGSEFGGIVPYVPHSYRWPENMGEASVLATAPRIVSYYGERDIDVVQIRGIDRPVRPLRDLRGLQRLTKYLRAEKPLIVHTHTSKGGLIGRLAARRARVPIIIHTTQGYAFSDYASNSVSRLAFLAAEKAATRWCDFIIAANEADRLKAIEHGIAAPSRIETILNSLDLDEADAALAGDVTSVWRELGLDPSRPTVGAMARLAPQKGIDVLIDAMSSIAAAHPDAQFLIVGTGELQDALRSQAGGHRAWGQSPFCGHRADWYRVLKTMDVFVMPSRWEGLPITLLGAMAARRPIVATRIKGIVDICAGADVAKLVPPDDSSALSSAVNALLSDRVAARAAGERARAHLEANFTDKIMKERTWRIYETVARVKGVTLE